MRPSTAFKKKTPVVPEHTISAFDKFNREILEHKVVNEPVKRLKPKSALGLSTKRIQSARRKLVDLPTKDTFLKRVGSAKSLKTSKAIAKPIEKEPQYMSEKDSIINLNIPM